MLCRMGQLSQKQEDFCRFYIEYGTPYAAYVAAYGPGNSSKKTLTQAASRAMGRPAIKARFAELRVVVAEAAAMTPVKLAQQLMEDRKFARDNGNAAAAVKATENLGKLLGFFVEKKEIMHGMRPDEARATIDALLPDFLAKRETQSGGGE